MRARRTLWSFGDSRHDHDAALQVEKIGARRFDISDPYHLALTLRWPAFLICTLASLILINVIFASLYWIVPGTIANSRPGSFQDAFFFSVETLATVGYGEMSPATTYGHWIAVVETFVGMAFTAIFTGLFFVRFSRPQSRIVFANTAVICQHNDRPTLMVRLANRRLTILADTDVRLSVLLQETSSEGQTFRRVQNLQLQRSRFAVFILTLTVMHTIDETSPLFGFDEDKAFAEGLRLFFNLEARNTALASVVYDLKIYTAENIKFGVRYADATLTDEDGTARTDLSLVSNIESDAVF